MLQAMKEKIEKTKEIEKEMNEILNKVEKEYNYRIGDSLIDREGYPRNDIDVYSISKCLQRFREIRSEWQPLRKEIEEELNRKKENASDASN